MKRIFTLLTGLALAFNANAQTVLFEDFESVTIPALPGSWTKTATATTAWKTNNGQIKSTNDWVLKPHTNYAVIDDWNVDEVNNPSVLTSHVFDLTAVTGAYLSFDYYYVSARYSSTGQTETCYVQISTNSGGSWTNIDTLTGNPTEWQTVYLNLAAYDNMDSMQIAFRYSDAGAKLPGVGLDNIKVYVPPANDAALTRATPVIGTPTAYAAINTGLNIGGTIFNMGTAPITSYTVYYQQDANTPVATNITGVNIAPFTSANFTAGTPYTMPGALGDYNFKVWVELTGDASQMNDSGKAGATAVAYMPTKKLLAEEATGTWCGWCPRGHVYMDSIVHTPAMNASFSLIAVHNNDPMVVTDYDAKIGALTAGYPSLLVDRRDEVDPSELVDIYNNQKGYFGYADITMSETAVKGTNFSMKVTVKPAIDLTGDYRLALVITEDGIMGNNASWSQANYYSNYAPLIGAGRNWMTSPNPVPYTDIEYDHVARKIYPDPNGAPGSLPATMTAGNTYDYTFNVTVPYGVDRSHTNAVVMLIRASDGQVLNSNNMVTLVGVNDVVAGINEFAVYPNPANTSANVRFTLDAKAEVNIIVTDALGRVVHTRNAQMDKGTNSVKLDVTSLPSGVYNVTLSTEKGRVSTHLNVVK